MTRRSAVGLAPWGQAGRGGGDVRARVSHPVFARLYPRVYAVVASLVLCSIRDVPCALAEAARVLRPGGRGQPPAP